MSDSVTRFFGLDYHKDSIQLCILDEKGNVLVNKKLPNSVDALVAMTEQHGMPTRAAIEACNGAPCLVETLRHEHGWRIDQAHAAYVAKMKQSPDKSDYSDARVLADLARVDYLPIVWAPPKYIRTLRDLIRRRNQLVKNRTREKLRIRALLRRNRLKCEHRAWTKAWGLWLAESEEIDEHTRWLLADHLDTITYLNGKIKAVETKLEAFSTDDPLIDILRDQKGIGPVTAWVMRAEIADFGRFKNGKQLSNFCGLTPKNTSSGDRQATGGLIRTGAPMLRSTIIEATHCLVRCDEHFGKLFRRMYNENSRSRCLVIAAVANRWIRKLYHVINAEVVRRAEEKTGRSMAP